MTSILGFMLGGLLVVLGLALVLSLIGAVTMKLAMIDSLNYSPSFRTAYWISLQAGLIPSGIFYVVWLASEITDKQITLNGYVVLAILAFISNAYIISSRVRHPDSGAIGFGKACLLTLAQLVIGALAARGCFLLFEFMTEKA